MEVNLTVKERKKIGKDQIYLHKIEKKKSSKRFLNLCT